MSLPRCFNRGRTMKQYIVAAVAATFIAPMAHAFDIGGDTTRATAIAGAAAGAHASNRTKVVNKNYNSAKQGQLQGQLQGQHQSMSGGNVTVNDRLQAPALAAPSMSSGHPCAYGTSFGLSLVGGAGSFGNSRIDDACLLAQMGYKDAAMVMVASRSGAAKNALERTGYIAPASSVSTRSVQPETVGVAYTSCKIDDGAIRVGVKRGADEATKARAVSECKATLR